MSIEQRAAVVAEVKTWLGTPYHHMGRIKGGGVDCATLIIEVYSAAGVIQNFETEYYPQDWMLHRDMERYMGTAEMRGAVEFAGPPKPGDLLLVKFGRCFSHGAVVIDWPLCFHATVGQNCGYVDALRDAVFKERTGELRPFKYFTMWPE